MKKLLTIILVLAFCLALGGCVKHPDGQAEGTETATNSPSQAADGAEQTATVPSETEPAATEAADDRFYVVDLQCSASQSNITKMLETDDAYYFLSPMRNSAAKPIVYFSDKELKEWLPLCGKANCLHNNDQCDAWLEGKVDCFWLYGRSIYYVDTSGEGMGEGPQLWRMDLDGRNHECLATLKQGFDIDGGVEPMGYRCFFHNKYVFVDSVGQIVGASEDSGTETVRCCYMAELDDPKHCEKLEFTLDSGETIGIGAIYASEGDILYGLLYGGNNTVYRYDISSRTAKALCTLPFDPDFRDNGLHDGKLYICDYYRSGLLLSVDTVTGELAEVVRTEPATELWARPYGDYIFGWGGSFNDAPNGTRVYDYSGNLIEEIPYEDYDCKDLTLLYALGDCYFAYEYIPFDSSSMYDPPVWYLRVSEVGTDNFRWHRWEPDGD